MTTRTLLALIACGWLMAAAITYTARAGADTADVLYLEILSDNGIHSTKGPSGLIAAGHLVCDAFAIGESMSDVTTLLLSNNPGLNAGDVGSVIGAATGAYCEQFAWKFGGKVPAVT